VGKNLLADAAKADPAFESVLTEELS
jgi:hypothetical protein